VKVFEVDAQYANIAAISDVLLHPRVHSRLGPEFQGFMGVLSFVDLFRDGVIRCWGAIHDGRSVGVLWVHPDPDGGDHVIGHTAFVPDAWGRGTVQAVKDALSQVYTEVRIYVPRDNPLAYRLALKAGMHLKETTDRHWEMRSWDS
jgi:RimJ/RimL family protein N-acetyltransferase